MRGTICDSFTRSSTDVKNMRGATSSKMPSQYVVLIRVCACILLPESPGSGHSISLLGLRITPRITSFHLLFQQWDTLLLTSLLYLFGLVISVGSVQRTGHCATFILFVTFISNVTAISSSCTHVIVIPTRVYLSRMLWISHRLLVPEFWTGIKIFSEGSKRAVASSYWPL